MECIRCRTSGVHELAETLNPLVELVREVRERLAKELQAQAEQIQKLEQSLQELGERHRRFEGALEQQLQTLEKVELPSGGDAGHEGALEGVLGAVRNLITATLPEQVLQVVTEEASQMGLRAAVFDVRGRAAWGSAASGFGSQLPQKVLRTLAVPLNQDNPFRQVYETGGHVDANAELLKKNRNLLDKFKPASQAPILLLPIRSAGLVSAIFYADPGSEGKALPANALKILTEFAGAQLDRLMALSGGVPAAEEAEVVEAEPAEVVVEAVAEEEKVAAATASAAPVQAAPLEDKAAPVTASVVPVEAAPVVEVPPSPVVEAPPASVVEAPPAPAAEEPPPPPPPAAEPAGFQVSQLSEEEQKTHKDAKRFAKLLISEIGLYNKVKVADGRKSKDIYKRLKSDIDRSRQTFEKRFGKTVGKQFDYFHEELVRTLAANDASALGADYPGPTA